VVFFKTRAPVEPVAFVERICRDTAAGVQLQNCRYVKRLTPITKVEKANQKGLEAVAKEVLEPWFHAEGVEEKKVSFGFCCTMHMSEILTRRDTKFAIRPSIRNNKELTRDGVIKTVASIVGPGHKVDLHGYDLLIIVEIYKVLRKSLIGPLTSLLTSPDVQQNVVGMSVVGPDFEKLKRFNLEELRAPPSQEKPAPAETKVSVDE
jgi:tRNA acetyltransferase TAN1